MQGAERCGVEEYVGGAKGVLQTYLKQPQLSVIDANQATWYNRVKDVRTMYIVCKKKEIRTTPSSASKQASFIVSDQHILWQTLYGQIYIERRLCIIIRKLCEEKRSLRQDSRGLHYLLVFAVPISYLGVQINLLLGFIQILQTFENIVRFVATKTFFGILYFNTLSKFCMF